MAAEAEVGAEAEDVSGAEIQNQKEVLADTLRGPEKKIEDGPGHEVGAEVEAEVRARA